MTCKTGGNMTIETRTNNEYENNDVKQWTRDMRN